MKDDEKRLLGTLQAMTNYGETKPYTGDVVEFLEIPVKRAAYILEKWVSKDMYQYGVSIFTGWLTEKGKIFNTAKQVGLIPYSAMRMPGTWWVWKVRGFTEALYKCKACRSVSSLKDYDITKEGLVMPSFSCHLCGDKKDNMTLEKYDQMPSELKT
jgi:hypothetical protein